MRDVGLGPPQASKTATSWRPLANAGAPARPLRHGPSADRVQRGVWSLSMGACSVPFAAHAVVIGIQAKWVGRTY
jgi:hypothetical protein